MFNQQWIIVMTLKTAIDLFGSQSALAREINVEPQTVSAWINRVNKPSIEAMYAIQRVTDRKVTIVDLLNEFYCELEEAA